MALSLALVALFLTAPVAAQVHPPVPDPPHADFEAEALSGWSAGIRSSVVAVVGGELFDGLGRGVTIGLEAGAEFDDRYSVRLALAGARHPDDLAEDHASTVDLSLEPAGAWERGGWRLEAGAIVGYTWLDRGIQVERAGGFVVGGGVTVWRSVTRSLELGLGMSATWSAFRSPDLVDHPPDPDGQAVGHRIRVGVHLARRWARR